MEKCSLSTLQVSKANIGLEDLEEGFRTIAGQDPSSFASSIIQKIGSKFTNDFFAGDRLKSCRWTSLAKSVCWQRDET